MLLEDLGHHDYEGGLYQLNNAKECFERIGDEASCQRLQQLEQLTMYVCHMAKILMRFEGRSVAILLNVSMLWTRHYHSAIAL